MVTKNILLFGGSGKIGEKLVSNLSSNYNVFSIDKNLKKNLNSLNIKYIKYNLLKNKSLLRIPKKIDFVLTTPAEPSSMHGIQGINDGANFLLNKHILDDEIPISTDSAVEYMHQLGLEKGLMVGISSAANILAAKKWKEKRPNGGAIVTMLCDRGERYL